MGRGRRAGATAAAALPAALAGALMVSAPFAGTTTSPLAKSTAHSTPVAQPKAPAQATKTDGIPIRISPGSVAMLALAETALVGVGAGVIVVARRRRYAET